MLGVQRIVKSDGLVAMKAQSLVHSMHRFVDWAQISDEIGANGGPIGGRGGGGTVGLVRAPPPPFT